MKRAVLMRLSLLALGLVAAACGDEQLAAPGPLQAPVAGQVMGERVPCPRNDYGFRFCYVPTPEQMDVLLRQLGSFAPTGACQEAAGVMRDMLSAPVYIGTGGWAGAMASYSKNPQPPHNPNFTIFSDYLLMPEHVAAGNLRRAMYHEASHLMGYEDVAPSPDRFSAYEFDEACRRAETVPTTTQTSWGGAGDKDPNGGTCYILTWWYTDTGEIFKKELLFCM